MNDILPSWREGPTRRAIVRFVETVTSQDDSDYVPPPERVAVFDNDGTLWCEKPMVELIHYLGANGFAIYIASGGGRDFMRPVTQEIYGVPRERVIGSDVTLRYVADEHGGRVVREAELGVLDDGPAKPTRIWSRVGRRPILAAGNSNGDIEMLRFAERPLRPSLSLLVCHDDAEREFAYDAGAERSLEVARERGWTIVSMRDDWKTVYGVER